MQSDYDSGRDAGYNDALEEVSRYLDTLKSDLGEVPEYIRNIKNGDLVCINLNSKSDRKILLLVHHIEMIDWDHVGIFHYFGLTVNPTGPDIEGDFFENPWVEKCHAVKISNIKEATESDRDLFFRAMKEYGYTWNYILDRPTPLKAPGHMIYRNEEFVKL